MSTTATVNKTDWSSSFFKQADMGRRYKNAEAITGAFARTLIEKAGLLSPPSMHLSILDNAGGTGVVTAALHDLLPQSTKENMDLTCGDFAEPMLQAAGERIKENGWVNTTTKLVDAQ
ncbi:MAG: hypothetical protein Q9222_002725, partial [Ikaeria aurantiellina]